MYKKAISGLILMSLLFLFGTICVDGAVLEKQFAVKASDVKVDGKILNIDTIEELAQQQNMKADHAMGIMDTAVSDQRVVRLRRIEHDEDAVCLLAEDRDILLRIVEAEAGNQDEEGRLLIANVVLNRMRCDAFPDTVQEVVLQQQDGCFQFSPVANGRIWNVTVSQDTEKAVERALNGEDISEGALYFAARQYADQSSMKWFDDHLTYLFAWGDHEFFK